jgi:hypothetical protein
MDWTRLLSIALVILVVLWVSGATVELLITTFSVGSHVQSAALVVAALAVVLAVGIAVGARGRQWLANPGYW